MANDSERMIKRMPEYKGVLRTGKEGGELLYGVPCRRLTRHSSCCAIWLLWNWVKFLPSNLPIAAGNQLIFEFEVVAIFPAGTSTDFDGLAEGAVFNAVVDVGLAETSIGHDELQVNERILANFHDCLRAIVYL